jgi:hypothetical protein
MSKGLKICDCGLEVGCRTRICPNCGQQFIKKLRPKGYKKGKPVEWNTLQKNDEIKAIQGHGPYKGVFRVESIDEYGIHGYQGNAHYYLNMVERQGKNGFIPAHKIEKL